MTPTSITVGYVYAKNAAAEQAVLGATVDEGDPLAEAQAVVTYINAHGGLGGRSINFQPYGLDATSTETVDQQEAAICANYTSDVPAFAVLGAADQNTATCLSKAGIESISDQVDSNGAETFNSVSNFLDTEDETPQDAMPNLVDALSSAGYFTTKWDTSSGAPGGALPVKVGIIYPEVPSWEDAVTNQLLPALKARGVTVDPADLIGYSAPQSTADDGSTVAQIQAAVLKFRSDNVTDVIPTEVNALGFFSIGASSQKYQPRYGLSTATEAELAYTSGIVPSGQLDGAVGFGWNPLLDLTDASNYSSAARAACVTINSAAGNALSGSAATLIATNICDMFFLLQKGVGAIGKGRPVTATAVTDAVGGLGSSFPFATLPSGSYSPSKHFPVSTGWAYSWSTACSCMGYTGPAYALR